MPPPKRILQLTINFSPNTGGLETHLDDLVKVSSNEGYENIVLSYNPLTTTVSAKCYEKKPFYTIYRIPWPRGLFYKLVNKPALEFIYLAPVLSLVTPFIVLIKKPDVIHAHGLIAGFAGIFSRKILRKKLIISTHAVYGFRKKSLFGKFAKYIFSSSDKILCLSQESAKEVQDLGVPASKTDIFTNWIDTTVFKVLPKNDNIGAFNVLFVGRLVPEKGVLELINAAKILKNLNITISIAGNGSLDSEVSAASKANKNINYIGSVPNAQLPALFNNADVCIIPSTHEEGFGRVALESLSCGVPVIAARRGGLKKIITKDTGFFTETSPDEIAKTITKVFENRKKLNAMAIKGRESVVDQYGPKLAKKILNTYN